MYVVPTFHNPTGRSMSVTERVRLVALAEGLEVPIVEDDVYRELYYDSPPPPSLWSLAANRARGDGARVLRVGSFSKWVAPGLRVGWLSLRVEDARAVRESGLLWSGGGIAHLSGSVVGHALASGALDAHADWVRAALCERRDALVTALAGRLRGGFELEPPGGGYFAWLRGPASVNLARLIDEAARRKVCFYPGERFGAQPGTIELRLAFPYYPPSQLAAGAASLADAIDLTLEETG
jgi:DNA-binding transcriptional MocR family regulator